MRDRKVLALLRRIALGLPVAVGPLVIGLSSSGGTHCYSLYQTASSHPRSTLTDSFVGAPESFDPTNCNALCRVLDGLDTPDGSAGDAGPRINFPTPYPERVQATCAYSDSATLSCLYVERWCETSASCNPAIYGRTPTGLLLHRSPATSALGRWLAEGAHLEAASVPAFEQLGAELESLAAPAALVRAARESAGDERRHARSLRRLAHRLGAPVAAVRRTETELRGPEEVALDNAVEGCVREAYGALAAAVQAEQAASRAVRRVYRAIAADEARHSLLSFAANDWLASRVSSATRRRTEEARLRGLAALAASLQDEPEHPLRVVLGLPDATRGTELLSLLA